MTDQKLPPLPDEAFDGYKETANVPRDEPLPKRCNHKNVILVSAIEMKCSCGVGWTGENMRELYQLLRNPLS